jgi:hypothetical protein
MWAGDCRRSSAFPLRPVALAPSDNTNFVLPSWTAPAQFAGNRKEEGSAC